MCILKVKIAFFVFEVFFLKTNDLFNLEFFAIQLVRFPDFIEKGFLNVPPPLPKIDMKKVNIKVEINTLDDILKLIDDYPIKHDTIYNIDMKAIHNIKQPITDLNNMIGMKKLKESIYYS